MNNEQVPSEKVRSLQPEATHIARVAHNLILSVFVVAQVSFSFVLHDTADSPPQPHTRCIVGVRAQSKDGHARACS